MTTITRTKRRDLETLASATYSPCELYRYELSIRWGDKRPVMVIGLNPSTATERDNDNTITRLERWARRNGFSELRMYNAYAFRSTDPKGLLTVDDPVGPLNFEFIVGAICTGAIPIVAWGANINRDHEAKLLERIERFPLMCFTKTKSGHPGHPLYLSDKTLDQYHPFNK
jgi:hypothetical protein